MSEDLKQYGPPMSQKDQAMMSATEGDSQQDKSSSNEEEDSGPDVYKKIEESLHEVANSLAVASAYGKSKEEMEAPIADAMNTLAELRSEVSKPEYADTKDFDSGLTVMLVDMLMGKLYPGRVHGTNEQQMRGAAGTTIHLIQSLFDISGMDATLDKSHFSKPSS